MLIVVIYIIPEGRPADSFRFLNLHHYMGITLMTTEDFSADTGFIRYLSFRKKLEAGQRGAWLLCKEQYSVLDLQIEM